MSAGGECRINMHDALKECLAATGDEHQCVARIADKCLGASRWAKNEMRRAACLEAEDLTWVARYQEAAGALKDMLDDEGRALLGNASAARRQHSGYACEMFRNAAGSDNRIAWADCRMQASARLAIDIRDLARTAGALSEPEREPGQEDEGEDKNADEPGGVIPDPTDARKHSRKDIGGDGAPGTPTQEVAGVVRPKATLWGALAFTAGGSYASAWRHATKAEAEAAVLKDCTKLDEGRCEVISFEGKYCAALASYRTSAKRKILRGAFTGAGETVTAAQASAHEQCKAAMIRRGVRGECSLRAVLCGDGR